MYNLDSNGEWANSWHTKEFADISELEGKTLVAVKQLYARYDNDILLFICDDGTEYAMYHEQDCCENVTLEDTGGDLNDLVGSPILYAIESCNVGESRYMGDGNYEVEGWPDNIPRDGYTPESFTWTFYNIATNKGSVSLRWYGSSNGYYSESVSVYKKRAETN